MTMLIKNTKNFNFLRLWFFSSITYCLAATDEIVDYDQEELTSDYSSPNDTLNQLGCRIPHLDLFSENVMKIYGKEPDLICNVQNASFSNSSRSPLFIEDTRFLYFNASALPLYGSEKVFCFYLTLVREDGPYDTVSYDISNILSLDQPNEITDEFIEVICKDKKTADTIYRDFFAFLPLKKATEKRCDTADMREGAKEQSLNTLVIGLDTLSRLQFHRHFSRSSTFLKERLDALEMVGYNKVAENTYPNLVPLLTGLSAKELKEVCLQNNYGLADTCPIIWKKYHQEGFRTIFVEDAPDLAIFNFGAKGFHFQPTDYYVRPMYLEYERNLGHNALGCGFRCLGSRSSLAFLLNHAEKTARVFRDKKYFGFHWSCSATHDTFNIPAQVDETLENFLETLTHDNLLNNTLLIVMSDHGPRLQKRGTYFFYTSQGQCEKRLPLLILVFPDWFKKKYAKAIENVRRNSHMLTTHFDLHRTLHDSMNLSVLEEENLQIRYKIDRKLDHGRSLFLPISTNRTCLQANIPPEFCACDCTSLPVPIAPTVEALSTTPELTSETIQGEFGRTFSEKEISDSSSLASSPMVETVTSADFPQPTT